MSDARWLDVDDDVQKAVRHFANAREIHETGGFDDPGISGYKAGMALMHAMLAGYTAVEAALKRILDIIGEARPTGDDWHAKLLDRLARPVGGDGARPPLLDAELVRDLHEARRFRHRAAHAYDDFDPDLAQPSMAAASRIAERLPAAVGAFKAALDPPA